MDTLEFTHDDALAEINAILAGTPIVADLVYGRAALVLPEGCDEEEAQVRRAIQTVRDVLGVEPDLCFTEKLADFKAKWAEAPEHPSVLSRQGNVINVFFGKMA